MKREKSFMVHDEPAVFEMDKLEESTVESSTNGSEDRLSLYFRTGRLLERLISNCDRQLAIYRKVSNYYENDSFAYQRRELISTKGNMILLVSRLANGPPQEENYIQQKMTQFLEVLNQSGKVLTCAIDDVFDVYIDEADCMN